MTHATPAAWLRATLAALPAEVTSLGIGCVFSDADDIPRIDAALRAEIVGADGATHTFVRDPCTRTLDDPPDSCGAAWEAVYSLEDDLAAECREFIHLLPEGEYLMLSRGDLAVDPRGATERPPAFGDVKPIPADEVRVYAEIAEAIQAMERGEARTFTVVRNTDGRVCYSVRP